MIQPKLRNPYSCDQTVSHSFFACYKPPFRRRERNPKLHSKRFKMHTIIMRKNRNKINEFKTGGCPPSYNKLIKRVTYRLFVTRYRTTAQTLDVTVNGEDSSNTSERALLQRTQLARSCWRNAVEGQTGEKVRRLPHKAMDIRYT